MSRRGRFLVIIVASGLLALALGANLYPRRAATFAAETDRSAYQSGEPVGIWVLLKAGGNAPTTVLWDGCEVSFTVADEGRKVIGPSPFTLACWGLSGKAPIVLQPGQDLGAHFTWNQDTTSGSPVAPGHAYEIRPIMTSDFVQSNDISLGTVSAWISIG